LNTSAAEVSKRTSPLERRETVKRNGEACRVKVRSDVAAERTLLCGEGEAPVLDSRVMCRGASRGMTLWGTSHRGWSASVMRTCSRLSVSRLPQ